jgi:hypothetical protein
MAIGLTRAKNLSERNLNLKTALQKLYAPGIENDITLFSLSSSVESVVVSGLLNSSEGQIVGVRSESLSLITGEVQPRTKFLTNFFTLTDLNEVAVTKFTLTTPGGINAVLPKTSQVGELHDLDTISGGRGFYFELPNGDVLSNSDDILEVENVSVRGVVSGKQTAKAKIVFIKHPVDGLEAAELTKFTPNSTDRYSIFSIEITSSGPGYIFPEPLELVEGNVRLSSDDSVLVLKKQKGRYFSGQPELLRSKVYTYQVRGADGSGFFLYDTKINKYVFLERDTGEGGFTQQEKDSIELRRFDGININNFLQFKFAQSRIWLGNDGLNSGFRIQGGSISGEINRVASVTNNLQLRTQSAIQNTRRPTPSTSSENILGYRYNSFDGEDVVIWQRVVLRDPDFVLDPNNPDFTANSITGTRLRESVENFELQALNSTQKIRVPGLFIKVGPQYFRAFSTTDKPFFAEPPVGEILNPKLSPGADQYALSAESLVPGSSTTPYSYNVVISELAQRIAYDISETDLKLRSKNGALYYHRAAAPLRRTIQTSRADGTEVGIFAVPLFSLG